MSTLCARLAALAIAVLAVGCAAPPPPPGMPEASSGEPDPPIGAPPIAPVFIAHYGGVVAADDLGEYLADVCRNVAQAAELVGFSGRAWTVSIVRSPRWVHFSDTQGSVFISRGLLLDVVANEAQLAAVLAHEMAHVHHADLARELEQRRLAHGVEPGGAAGSTTTRIGRFTPREVDETLFASARDPADPEARILDLSYERADEKRAAISAIEILVKANYNAPEVPEMMRYLDRSGGEFRVHQVTPSLVYELERIAAGCPRGEVRTDVYRQRLLEPLRALR